VGMLLGLDVGLDDGMDDGMLVGLDIIKLQRRESRLVRSELNFIQAVSKKKGLRNLPRSWPAGRPRGGLRGAWLKCRFERRFRTAGLKGRLGRCGFRGRFPPKFQGFREEFVRQAGMSLQR
jgi:hypothetical protein